MWKRVNGHLIHITDPSRVKYKTYISRKQLDYLRHLEEVYDTHVSYLLENGIKNAATNVDFSFLKKDRLRDKIEFRTTCDKEILEQGRSLAKKHGLNFTDVIQASIEHIDLTEVKSKDWRYRIE